jgi:hypothetical protein
MNILLGLVLMLLCVSFSKNLYSNTVRAFVPADTSQAVVTEYMGLQVGDTIVKIDNNHINVRYDYLFSVMRTGNNKCTLTVMRNGEKVIIDDFVFPYITQNDTTILNPSFFIPEIKSKTF